MGWIGVDLDGTLAVHEPGEYDGSIGRPIKPMVERVKKWLKDGKEVKIMTARAWNPTGPPYLNPNTEGQKQAIKDWCVEHIGEALPITCQKDYRMIELWDDRAIQVERNTGKPVAQIREAALRQIVGAIKHMDAKLRIPDEWP